MDADALARDDVQNAPGELEPICSDGVVGDPVDDAPWVARPEGALALGELFLASLVCGFLLGRARAGIYKTNGFP